MVTIRSVNEIILNLMDFFKLAQPDLDTKPGTVARDLFIDAPASQVSILYDELSSVANTQSLRLSVGTDLDKLAKNFGVVRRQSSASSGAAIFTFSSINSPININRGDTVIASNGFSFSVTAGVAVVPGSINLYRSIATKFRDQLDFAGISDTYAIQVTVTATSPGSAGNIGTYSINRTSIAGVSNVTNVNSFNGGTDQETDAAFRNRVLSTFSGSSVGTALGYTNVALSVTGVGDALIVQPGDALMTRDGTVVSIAADGTRTIVSEGSGGKVDVVVLGTNLVENSDSYIYKDKSNNGDPSSVKNNVVLGQIVGDENKTVNRKRIDNIKNGALPVQPVNTILQVTGSVSGSNFVEKSVDSLGRVSGNFELLKDTGIYGGSPWGFDTFHWISNKISLFSEDKIKGQFNGQDGTTFTDITEIPTIQYNLSITNENSSVTTDRSIIQLLHVPATNVTRVFNVNTGERYVITNQNLDQTGTFNTTGRIKILGNTLPSPSDQLQVDYNWIVNFDQYSDYDGLINTKNPRTSTDSIDWGYASAVRNEKVLFTAVSGDNFYLGNVVHPINTIISAKKSLEVDGTVVAVTSGTFINRLAVIASHLVETVNTVDSVTLKNSNAEIFNTAQANGLFTVATEVFGIEILYVATIILPTDTIAVAGSKVTVIINSADVFHSDLTEGSSSGTQITIPSSLINTTASNIILSTTYITSISDLFNGATTAIPTSRTGNGFTLSNNIGFNNLNVANISRRENQVVQKNLSNEYFVEITLPSADFNLSQQQIVSVVRLSDSYELWNSSHDGYLGTIIIGSSGNYQLILSGFNTPATGDRVLVIYYATDIRRFQPFSYSNTKIKNSVEKLAVVPITNKLTVPLNNITVQSGLKYSILEPNTDIVLFSGTDGYFTTGASIGTGKFSSLLTSFNTLPDLINKKLKIVVPTAGLTNCNNDGVYDIISYDINTNIIVVSNILDNITSNQISVIRLLDGQDIWNSSCTIDLANNRLLIPSSTAAAVNDAVFVSFFNFQTLRKAPTRLVGTTVDQTINPGILTVSGMTLSKAEGIIFTATNTGLKLNLSEAVRKSLSISSSTSLPTNVRIAKIIKVDKVATVSASDDSVLEVLASYDIVGTTIQNNLLYSDEMLADSTLQAFDFILPNTSNNSINTVPQNLPTIGDKIRVTFYYVTDNDYENLSYTRNGTLYTNKQFALINKIFISSGFKASTSTRFTAASFTQPGLGARYKVFYDYIAPKQNERIVVKYNYNKLISDVTFSIEGARPINADVLARAAKTVLLDLTINVVIDPTMTSSTDTIIQNLKNQLISTLTTTELEKIVDQPTIINVAQAVSGISRARILYFNKNGSAGTVLKVQAQADEYFSSNIITINTETR
jgi:phage-related baseplate assembly protein